ncbi:polysaccharide deacetylase family protein [Thalassotalea euphylliae]|uniref:polysaccharide deacetylase family protein n=1 Tax=Thalassotalea euphylliae TaxID=1655234 RepID=UPI00362CE932
MRIFHRVLHGLFKLVAKPQLSMLIYHQVVESRDAMRPDEPTAAEFEWQMALVSQYFTPMSLSDAKKALANDSLPKDAICVTFDDGYVNNLTVAQPILEKYDVPATVYVATGFCDGDNMFNDRIIDLIGDDKRSSVNLESLDMGIVTLESIEQRITLYSNVIKQIKYLTYPERKATIDKLYKANDCAEYPSRMMTPSQIKALSDTGVTIGAHTVDHPILRTLTEAEQRKQISDSKTMLENLVGKVVCHFAYPNGKLGDDYSSETRNIVEEQGFETAVSTHNGVSNKETDIFQLKRFTPWDKSPLKFHLRLLLTALKG